MKWIVSDSGHKIIDLSKVDMIYIDQDEEKPEGERFSIVARNKEFKAYLCLDKDVKYCYHAMKYIIDELLSNRRLSDEFIDLRNRDFMLA